MVQLSLLPGIDKKLSPRRGGGRLPRLDRGALAQKVVENSKLVDFWAQGLVHTEPALHELHARVGAFLGQPLDEPLARDLAEAIIAASAFRWVGEPEIQGRWLAASLGLEEAVNLLIQPLSLKSERLGLQHADPPVRLPDGALAPRLLALRPWLMVLPDADYERIRANVLPHADTLSRQSIIACALDDAELAARAAQQAMTIQPGYRTMDVWTRGLIGVVRDPVVGVALLQHLRTWIAQFPPENVYDVLTALPVELLEQPLLAIFESSSDDKNGSKAWAKVLACLESPAVAARLAAAIANPGVLPTVQLYFDQHPDLAAAALEPLARGRKKREAELASELLRRLAQRASGPVPAPTSPLPAVLERLPAPVTSAIPLMRLDPLPFLDRLREPVAQNFPFDPPSARISDSGPSASQLLNHYAPHVLLRDVSDSRALSLIRTHAANWGNKSWSIRPLLGRFGAAILPEMLAMIEKYPENNLELILDLCGPRVAHLVARLWLQTPGDRDGYEAWFDLYHDEAQRCLVHRLLTEGDPAARAVLRAQVVGGQRPALEAIAAELGGEQRVVALDRLAAWLDQDVAGDIPADLPKLPAFYDPTALPGIVLHAGGVLPPHAVENLGRMLQISYMMGRPYVGLEAVREACTPASLDTFSAALFTAWEVAGAAPRYAWALTQIGWIGGDDAARRLEARMHEWPKLQKVDRMHLGATTLGEQGRSLALMMLYNFGLRSRFADTQDHIARILERVARARGLSRAALEDTLVPTFGLENGLILDFGARRFRIVLDEQLQPGLTELNGQRLDKVPAVRKSDDAARARDEIARYKQLRDDLEDLGRGQLIRLERALAEQRTWQLGAFVRDLVAHPMVGLLVRRLVFDTGEVCFRVAEDGSFADVADQPISLPETATVRLLHPLFQDEATRKRWAELFMDYRIIQPFPQLSREVFRVTPEEADATVFARCAGRLASYQALIRLVSGVGWRRTPPSDGTVKRILRPLPDGSVAELAFTPGFYVGPVRGWPDQTIGALSVRAGAELVPLGRLPPLWFSELARDVLTISSG